MDKKVYGLYYDYSCKLSQNDILEFINLNRSEFDKFHEAFDAFVAKALCRKYCETYATEKKSKPYLFIEHFVINPDSITFSNEIFDCSSLQAFMKKCFSEVVEIKKGEN